MTLLLRHYRRQLYDIDVKKGSGVIKILPFTGPTLDIRGRSMYFWGVFFEK